MYIQNYGSAKSTTTVRTSISSSSTPAISQTVWTSICAANTSRQKVSIYNGSVLTSTTGIFYIAIGSAPANIVAQTPVDYTFTLRPGDLYEDTNSIDAIYAVIYGPAAASDVIFITEMR